VLAASRWERYVRGSPVPASEVDTVQFSTVVIPSGDGSLGVSLPALDDAGARVSIRADELHEFGYLTGRPDPEGHPHLLLAVGLSYEPVRQRLGSLRNSLMWALVAALGLATAGGWLLASRALKPIQALAQSVEGMDARDLSRRLPEPQSDDEMAKIVRSINNMFGRLERTFEAMGGFTADAAHELRTPLTAARCRLEVALEKDRTAVEYQDVLRDVGEQLGGLNKLVDNMLLLANLDARPHSYEREEVDLRELLLEIAEFFEILAGQQGIDLEIDCADSCLVSGNPSLLRRLFSNLIENALRHTAAGGRVRLSVEPGTSGAAVTVADTGEGMPPAAAAHIFQRFHRADASRSRDSGGFGLGLAITREIVEAHDGLIKVESAPGKGTTFHVYLPR